MLAELKREVLAANLELARRNLAIYTWGNASGIDRGLGLVVIKPSGVDYAELTEDLMTVVDLEGRVAEGKLRPSSDTPTHLELYKNFPGIGGAVHTHSPWATAWAQALTSLPCYGTTHADHFYGAVPCTPPLTREEIESDYEINTGKVIVRAFAGLDHLAVQGVLVAQHGPFTWGSSPAQAVENSVVLEEIARMAVLTRQINPGITQVDHVLLDKHYLRKHGTNAYYGQKPAAE